jgi:hypothetical protein
MMSKDELLKAYRYFGINFRNYFLGATTFSIIASTIISAYFPSPNNFLKLTLFLTIIILCQYLFLTFPYLLFSRHDFIISLFGYIILSDLKLVTKYSSLYNACLHIYRSNYPIVSEMFKKALVFGIRGKNLKEVLNDIAVSQPSQTFREGLQVLLEKGLRKRDFFRTYEEAYDIYRDLTSKIETKFSILMALCFFTPIVATVSVSMYFKEVGSIIIILSITIFLLSIVYLALARGLHIHRMAE